MPNSVIKDLNILNAGWFSWVYLFKYPTQSGFTAVDFFYRTKLWTCGFAREDMYVIAVDVIVTDASERELKKRISVKLLERKLWVNLIQWIIIIWALEYGISTIDRTNLSCNLQWVVLPSLLMYIYYLISPLRNRTEAFSRERRREWEKLWKSTAGNQKPILIRVLSI